jgi:hypothetical protein
MKVKAQSTNMPSNLIEDTLKPDYLEIPQK